jgi:hypothetical protein
MRSSAATTGSDRGAAEVRAGEEIGQGLAERAAFDTDQDRAGLFVPDLDHRAILFIEKE